ESDVLVGTPCTMRRSANPAPKAARSKLTALILAAWSTEAIEKSHTVKPATAPMGIREIDADAQPSCAGIRWGRALLDRCTALVMAPITPSNTARTHGTQPRSQLGSAI